MKILVAKISTSLAVAKRIYQNMSRVPRCLEIGFKNSLVVLRFKYSVQNDFFFPFFFKTCFLETLLHFQQLTIRLLEYVSGCLIDAQ